MEDIDKTVLGKIGRYCAYQERCREEVVLKLKSLEVEGKDVNIYIEYLEKNKFINQSRFVESYCRGKFRLKKWGKMKIQAGLRAKKISENEIKAGLSIIDDNEYESTCREVLFKKGLKSAISQGFEISILRKVGAHLDPNIDWLG